MTGSEFYWARGPSVAVVRAGFEVAASCPVRCFYAIIYSMAIGNIKKRGRGRPPVDSEAVMLRFPTPVVRALEAYAEDQRDPLTRSEAIRTIVARFLRSKGYLEK